MPHLFHTKYHESDLPVPSESSIMARSLSGSFFFCVSLLLSFFLFSSDLVQAEKSRSNIAIRQDDKPFLLRIMPLGASITAGVGTDPQNGYRKPLREQLTEEGWTVDMVGSEADGDFDDNQHEGHPGFVVDQMINEADKTIFDQPPNVVLINCGTNDADPNRDEDVPGTADRMRAVLEHLLDNVEGVTVVLSTLLPHKVAENDANVDIINEGYRSLVTDLAGQGQKVVLAEMNNGFFEPDEDYSDDLHPNEQGAAKMATVWDQALAEAEAAGFLTAPI